MQTLRTAIGLLLLTTSLAFSQSTSITGTVSDPTGAVIPGATLTLTSVENGAERSFTADGSGRYNMVQLSPGKYKLVAKAAGFNDVSVNNLELIVNQPATVNITFEKLGGTVTTVQVEASGTQVNTTDATIGNAITSQAIVELPSFARNAANLLSFQPGVTNFGVTDDRSGSVNGGKSDQANATLDGVDVNDQANRTAFTSVLRVTLDSVEEFRTTTTNGGADQGRGSGAEIALVTKSGSNELHGSLYEYRRGTETAANSFFSNRSGVPRAALLINVFGGTVGGAIKKNKAFYFLNYEGRRDASAAVVTRTVPTDNVKKGLITFRNTSGVVTTVGADILKNVVDPLGIGINANALKLLQTFPSGNNNSIGDGLNTTGYTFNAPVHGDQNTYIARFDYKIDNAGKHTLFTRGNLQNDSADGTPQFPGQAPNSVTLANNKGVAAGWTGVLTNSMVSTFRYGFTRAGGETTGILASNYTQFRGYDTPYGVSTGTSRIVPVHTISEDLSWNKGAHDIRFGGIARLVSNSSNSYSHSYYTAITNASVIKGSGADLLPSSLGVSKADTTSYEYTAVALLGIITSGTGNYNYKTDGSILPVGAPVARDFVNHEGEFYVQDSWKARRNLTITAGLRLTLAPPVYEANGQQVSTNVPISDWMNQRGSLGDQGLSAAGASPIIFNALSAPGSRSLYPFHTNWAPRLAVAYSPGGDSGWKKFLFGGPGKTSIRAGAGIYYDIIGQPLATTFNATAFGLASTISTPANTLTSSQLPRFTDFFTVPGQLVPAAPKSPLGTPYPNVFAITNSIDDKLKAPYTMNLNYSIGREFSHGFFFQASYVGRLSRKSLVNRDLAMPTNLKDPKSGQTYFQAMTALGQQVDGQGLATVGSNGVANVSKISPIPFFENMWSTAAAKGFSATQIIAKDYLENNNQGDFTSVLADMDNGSNCSKSGTTFFSNNSINQVGCGALGPFSIWSPQFSALSAWSSVGSGSYHAMQITLRKRFSNGLLFDFNYTLSKSIDLSSRAENGGSFSGFIYNTWNTSQLRAVSNYDALHNVNAYMIYQLPVGRNQKFGSNMPKLAQILVGGWQLSATYRQTSGLPFSVGDGSRWPTNWELSGFATPNGNPIPTVVSAHNAGAVSGSGGPNLWTNPAAALAGFSETYAGQSGSRNTLRGDGFFNIDTGLSKSFTMPYSEKHKFQIRWESFNVTNTVRLDPASANLSLTSTSNFGKLTGQLGSQRQMQFAARYSF